MLDTRLPGGAAARLRQETKYPWEGGVRFTVDAPGEFAIRLRIPGWTQGAVLKVNGRTEPPPKAGAYAEVRRNWKAGDRIELALPLEPRLVEANPLVEENWNQVAVARGPIVYCLESPDLPSGVRFHEVALPARTRLRARFDPQLLGGVTVLEGKARLARRSAFSGALYRTLEPASGEVDLRLIPYYAWANRGVSYMTVWLPLAP